MNRLLNLWLLIALLQQTNIPFNGVTAFTFQGSKVGWKASSSSSCVGNSNNRRPFSRNRHRRTYLPPLPPSSASTSSSSSSLAYSPPFREKKGSFQADYARQSTEEIEYEWTATSRNTNDRKTGPQLNDGSNGSYCQNDLEESPVQEQRIRMMKERQDLGRYTVIPQMQVPLEVEIEPTFSDQSTYRSNGDVDVAVAVADADADADADAGPVVSSPRETRILPHALGVVFAFNSGFLNGLGLSGMMGVVGSVSAVTGAYTNAAVAITKGGGIPTAITMSLSILMTPFLYAVGSMVNGLCNPEGSSLDVPNLDFLQSAPILLAGLLVGLARCSLVSAKTAATPISLACLSLAVGMQNSWTSNLLSGNLLRTSHMSGMTSDCGTILGQILRGNHQNVFKLKTFARLIGSFWLGGIVSAVLAPAMKFSTSACLTLSAIGYALAWSTVTQSIQEQWIVMKRHLRSTRMGIPIMIRQQMRHWRVRIILEGGTP